MLMRRPPGRSFRRRRRGRPSPGGGGRGRAGGGRMGGGSGRGRDDAGNPATPEPRHPLLQVILAFAVVVGGFVLIPVLLVAVYLLLGAFGLVRID